MTSRLALGLRLVAAVSVVATMVGAGFAHRSPWIVVLVTPVFTMLYALGKWQAWRLAWRIGGARRIAGAIAVALPIQAVVATICYVLGVGMGRLAGGPRAIAAASWSDVVIVAGLLAVAGALGVAVIRIERGAHGAPPPHPRATDDGGHAVEGEIELDVDPTPLTVDTFFLAPAHWRTNAARDAMEAHEVPVDKPPRAAREDMLAAAEERLGVRLPATLRRLYGVYDGGYVGWTYVPLVPDPGPRHDHWRGAFAIDYSSLVPTARLRTVAEHYADFTDDPDDLPANAHRLVVLQARYGDMTLLDYSRGAHPRVLIVQYDKPVGEDPVDVAFDDFDAFFAALRRERDDSPDGPHVDDLSGPLAEAPADLRARRFWGRADAHPFARNAGHRRDDSAPRPTADDDLVAATCERLGLILPDELVALWREKNGGGVASRFVANAGAVHEVMRFPVPLEYVVTLAELSSRIRFPAGETPWAQRHPDADRLVVLEADHDRALLLDYRDRADDDPAVLAVTDLALPTSAALRFESVAEMLGRLRFHRSAWSDVAIPHDVESSGA